MQQLISLATTTTRQRNRASVTQCYGLGVHVELPQRI